MKPSTLRILQLLRSKRGRGVTFDDVPPGTCITKRIAELRALGYDISSDFEVMVNGGRRVRWRLIHEPLPLFSQQPRSA